MTREEAIDKLEYLVEIGDFPRCEDALKMAIEALKEQMKYTNADAQQLLIDFLDWYTLPFPENKFFLTPNSAVVEEFLKERKEKHETEDSD